MAYSQFGEDSGWEDNNIFQSGAESSSPMRPSPSRSKIPRKSLTVRRSRKSMSAPPEMIDSSPTRSSPFSPPQSSFKPRFDPPPPLIYPSPAARRSSLAPAPVPASPFSFDIKQEHEESMDVSGEYERDGDEYIVPIKEESEQEEEVEEEEEETTQEADNEPEYEDSEDGQFESSNASVSATTTPKYTFSRFISSVILALAVSSAGYFIWDYKADSAAIGFCDTNGRTNSALENRRTYRAALEACNNENRTELYLPSLRGLDSNETAILCPLPPLVPWPYPDTCTQCPRQASCTQFSVQCDAGYILKPHPFLAFLPDPPQSFNLSISSSSTPSEIIWVALSSGLDGLPGFGPIALPPRCILDPRRQRNIGALGKAMESLLAQARGRRLCVGGKDIETNVPEEEGGEARKWGIALETLRETMKRKTSVCH